MKKLLITITSLIVSTVVVAQEHMTPQEWQNKRQPEIKKAAESFAVNIRKNRGTCPTSNRERRDDIHNLSEHIQLGAQPECDVIVGMFSQNAHIDVITDEAVFGYFYNCLQNNQFQDVDGFFETINSISVLLVQKLAERKYSFKSEQWQKVMDARAKAIWPSQRDLCIKVADIMSASMIAQEAQQAN